MSHPANISVNLRIGAVLALIALLAGCAHQRLVLAPEAQRVPMRSTAVTEADGVRLTVEPGAWTGSPQNLASEVTPLKVSIESVIDPQGSICGFLYFPKVRGEAERVALVAHLVEGRSGDGFGELSVPLRVE